MKVTFTNEQLQKLIRDTAESACQSMLSALSLNQNLDNCIARENACPEASIEGGNNMASKFREAVKVGVDCNGKPVIRWASGNTKEELQFNIAQLLINSGRFQTVQTAEVSPVDRSPKWEDYAANWAEVFHREKVREKTWCKDRTLIYKHVIPMLEGKHINSIASSDIQTQLNKRKSMSHSYMRDAMNLMKQIFDSAVDDGIIHRNPMESKKIFNPCKAAAKQRKALSAEDHADIIAHIPDLLTENDKMFVAFLMFTGMRPSEIYGMTWENIDFNTGMIRIDKALTFCKGKGILGDTKTESGKRTIPMDTRLAAYLLPNKGTGFVFKPSRSSCEHFTEQSAKRAWNRIRDTIDMHGMIPYEARHTYATNLSRNGVPMKTAMLLMGHKDERPLNRNYIHVDESDIKAAGRIMSGYYDQLAQ